MLTIGKKIAFNNVFKKKDNYGDTKRILSSLEYTNGGREFDMNWFNKHKFLLNHAFLKKERLSIFQYTNNSNIHYKGPLESMTLEEDSLNLSGKNFSIKLFKPSHGKIQINKGIGNSYEMQIYSKENAPSKIVLSYYNI